MTKVVNIENTTEISLELPSGHTIPAKKFLTVGVDVLAHADNKRVINPLKVRGDLVVSDVGPAEGAEAAPAKSKAKAKAKPEAMPFEVEAEAPKE